MIFFEKKVESKFGAKMVMKELVDDGVILPQDLR
jgi:hypothetical protein